MNDVIFFGLTVVSGTFAVVGFKILKHKISWSEEKIAGLMTLLGVFLPFLYLSYLLDHFKDLTFNLILLVLLPISYYSGSLNYKGFKEMKEKRERNS